MKKSTYIGVLMDIQAKAEDYHGLFNFTVNYP